MFISKSDSMSSGTVVSTGEEFGRPDPDADSRPDPGAIPLFLKIENRTGH
jgi:hypothetical protein